MFYARFLADLILFFVLVLFPTNLVIELRKYLNSIKTVRI